MQQMPRTAALREIAGVLDKCIPGVRQLTIQ
jgi:hypothetical protein